MNSVIHEIRNHLAVAVANIEGFRDGVLSPTPERLRGVLQALEEADVLLSELPTTAIARHDEPEMRAMDVCEIISNEVVALEGSATKRGLSFAIRRCVTSSAACRAFHGNPLRIAEIVNNVVSNAIRYTPPGGRIEVDCRHSDGSLVLTVADGGPGIAPEERSRIFESGYRGAAAVGKAGSGLGLGLARQFVEAHGGTIRLIDTDGPGARFVVSLPGTPLAPPVLPAPDGMISLV